MRSRRRSNSSWANTRLGEEFNALGVELLSLTEGIDTATPTGRALFGMCGVFAQLELDLLRERTRQGLAAARRRGKQLGRPRALDATATERARDLRHHGASVREGARALGVSLGTAHAAVRGLARGRR